MTRIKVDQRYSATLIFRWCRQCGLSRKTSYWVAVAKHGWPEYTKTAARQAKENGAHHWLKIA